MLKLNGLEFKNSTNNPPKQLIIMLHGYGSNGENMIDLAGSFSSTLPDAYFIAPNAPADHEHGYGGYQWFSLISRDENFILEGINYASNILNNYIDEQLARFNLIDNQLILIGFSQGAMLAIYAALRRMSKIAGVISYSGSVIGDKFLSNEIKSKPSILMIHGDNDDVVSPISLDLGIKTLRENQIPVKGLMCKGLAHSINLEGIKEAITFFKEIFLKH